MSKNNTNEEPLLPIGGNYRKLFTFQKAEAFDIFLLTVYLLSLFKILNKCTVYL
jgi:hypothetical protein